MGSDLYISIEYRRSEAGRVYGWNDLFEGPSIGIARGPIVDAFGDIDDLGKPVGDGYLSRDEIKKRQEHPDCPWRHDEPYWVRVLTGQEFCDIVRERRWKTLQDGDFADLQCRPEMKAFHMAIWTLIAEGCEVRVWCWHSQ